MYQILESIYPWEERLNANRIEPNHLAMNQKDPDLTDYKVAQASSFLG